MYHSVREIRLFVGLAQSRDLYVQLKWPTVGAGVLKSGHVQLTLIADHLKDLISSSEIFLQLNFYTKPGTDN